MGIAIVIVVIILIVIVWYINTLNSIKVAQLKIKEALSGIDVALTKRYDVLTKMLDAVKGYQKHEKELLAEVINLRMGMSMQERNMANSQMDEITDRLNLFVENYPELKASDNFVELQKAIIDVEEHLQAARRLYNANVTSYNSKLIMFPSSVVAGVMGATQEEFFVAEENKRTDVKIDF